MVIILMVVLLSITAPMGAKIFSQFQAYVKKTENRHLLNNEKAFAFIEAKDKKIVIDNKEYIINNKGIVIQ